MSKDNGNSAIIATTNKGGRPTKYGPETMQDPRLVALNSSYTYDNLLNSETESITGGDSNTVTYSYDADGNRASAVWPGGTTFNYSYTARNQLQSLTSGATTYATYGYNVNGDLISRTLINGTSSSYQYDVLDMVTHISHNLVGTARTFDYAYDNVGNRKWTKRDGWRRRSAATA